MDRRALLSAIGGSVVALPGCAGDDPAADSAANGSDDGSTGTDGERSDAGDVEGPYTFTSRGAVTVAEETQIGV